MIGLIGMVVSGVGAVAGYIGSRDFVRRRLRYVEAAQSPMAPLVAGAAAAIAAVPVVWILPGIGTLSAVAFGAAVGLGTRAGAADVRGGSAA